jgi:hypothetical protein
LGKLFCLRFLLAAGEKEFAGKNHNSNNKYFNEISSENIFSAKCDALWRDESSPKAFRKLAQV